MHCDSGTDLQSLMRRIASSVAVITSHGQDGEAGITATSVASVSLDPPSILVCINKATRLHAAVRHSRRFRVNYLATSDQCVATAFGGPHDGDRFTCGEWARNETYGPRLLSALGNLRCALDQQTDYGTHTVFIGRVQTADARPDAPLLYCNGAYACLAEEGPPL